MKNISKWGLGLVFVALVIIVFFQIASTNTNTSAYTTRIYTVNSGYGYEISMDNNILIKQGNIPAISELHTFCTSEDALKIANLVISKLEQKENPRITKEELKANAIALNCIN